MRQFDERSGRRTTTSSLTNRGLVSFWSEHAALRPSKCVLRELSQEHLGKKKQKRAARTGRPTPTAKPRAQSPHRSPEGRPHRRTANTEPQGPRTSTTQARTNTNTPHPHPHTETKRTRPGTVEGREPPKKKTIMSTRGKRPTRGVLYATFCRGQNRATFRRGRNRASHGSSRTTSGS